MLGTLAEAPLKIIQEMNENRSWLMLAFACVYAVYQLFILSSSVGIFRCISWTNRDRTSRTFLVKNRFYATYIVIFECCTTCEMNWNCKLWGILYHLSYRAKSSLVWLPRDTTDNFIKAGVTMENDNNIKLIVKMLRYTCYQYEYEKFPLEFLYFW